MTRLDFVIVTDYDYDFELAFGWQDDNHSYIEQIDLKVIVPSGIVIAMSKLEPGKILWKHKVKEHWSSFCTYISDCLSEVATCFVRHLQTYNFCRCILCLFMI